MPFKITHSKVSGKSDGADASLVQPSDWNEDHVVAEVEGWRDMVSDVNVRGQNVPTWSQMGTSPFWGYQFTLNDEAWAAFHIDHDYKPGTAIYFHTHWIADGTNVQPVKWEFTWTAAKGHNQSNFNMTGTTLVVQTTPPGTAWRHMISEISSPGASSSEFEPDTIIMMRIRRITNGATDNTDDIFLLKTDAHYQADRLTTPNRAPDFYN